MAAGIDPKHIYRDKKSGSTVDRPGLAAVLRYARSGDVIVADLQSRPTRPGASA
ncbi:MAG TPA: recombinase family protein [Nakamurella sp.]|nr:recombinase family protein [Nakamurella sp.]